MTKKFIIFLSVAVVFSLVLIAANSAIAKAEKNQNQEGIGNVDNSSLTVTNTNIETGTTTSGEDGVGPNGNNEKGQLNAEAHRSTVANFVQSLLQVANREGGIGQQVRVIAQQQNDAKEKVVSAIGEIQNRSKIKTFLIGTDYKNIGALRSEMVQTRNRLDQLNRLIESATNEVDKTELQNQITTLGQEQQKINDFLKANESKFSLFGWFVKLFNK